MGARRRARCRRQRGAASRTAALALPRHARGRHPRSPATGSTSACTRTPAISRSAGRTPTQVDSAATPNGRSAGPRIAACSTTAPLPTVRGGPGMRRVSVSSGTGRGGPATCPTLRSTARQTRDSDRSSCCPKASRGCSCLASLQRAPGRSTTSHRNRRCPNPLHAEQSANPAVRAFSTEYDILGDPAEYPIICTTYRLTEHFHFWTKNNPYNVQIQPEFFIEISEALARREGHRQRRTRARDVGARVDRGARHGDAAHEADADRRAA